MKKDGKKIIENFLYGAFAICFFVVLPLALIFMRIFKSFLIFYIPLLVFVIIVIISGIFSDKKENNVKEEMIDDLKLGKLKVVIDSYKRSLILEGTNILMNQNKISIKIEENQSIETYLEILRYLKEHQKEIEENLKYYYLLDYEENYVQENFHINNISSDTYQELIEYKTGAKDYITGMENLEKLIANSDEKDTFIYISSSCDKMESSYAFCYINCRTLEIAYWFDMTD